ncbi:hypothetical protein Ancab_017756 [Ancistrocladus abbreviatus]
MIKFEMMEEATRAVERESVGGREFSGGNNNDDNQRRARGRPRKFMATSCKINADREKIHDVADQAEEESTSGGGGGVTAVEEPTIATSLGKNKGAAIAKRRRKGTPKRAPFL